MRSYINLLRTFINFDRIKKYVFMKRILEKLKLGKLFLFFDFLYYSMPVKTSIKTLIEINQLDLSSIQTDKIDYTCRMYMSHRFNILGSGWIASDFNAAPLGINGHKYKVDSSKRPYRDEKILKLVSKGYSLIDWQRDLKSGYLFDIKKLSTDIPTKLPVGVDIKMPWELARMYHLPQLSIAALSMKNKRKDILLEFRNQVFDFFESNPIGYGVNWNCAMEVSIRAANLLIAYDIFTKQDKYYILDEEFKEYFTKKILEHGRFVLRNLELSITTNKNGNHYLSNLCGLLFISSYIECKETKSWYEFAKKEFLKEFDKQFLPDGGNYECSTAYHRLSAELAVYSFALIMRNGEKVINHLLTKLNSVAHFATMTIKPNGDIIQIGDNDSGRLFKLNLYGEFISQELYEKQFNLMGYNKIYREDYIFQENELQVDSLIANVFAITNYRYIKSWSNKNPLEYSFIKSLLNNSAVHHNDVYNYNQINSSLIYDESISDYKHQIKTRIEFPFNDIELKDSIVEYAPHFGLVTFTLDEIKIFIRSVADLEVMHNAHCHNDFLHFEISINEKNSFSDQGSYIYTPLPDVRNEFRSIKAHNCPFHGKELNNFLDSFNTEIKVKGYIVDVTSYSITLVIKYDDILHQRKFEIYNNSITVTDISNKPFSFECTEFVYESLGYGILQNNINNTNSLVINKFNQMSTCNISDR
ncbi:heparinase II/III family protein [Radiobacillus deserti]|uniref:Uncharacterized protein n=1 Tax=Radiobacillus deserti TaxID=2594883 RepID=A0A516KJ83_9BACI|nr:heparinase II/III family protein [Radiobacillus deserti]QDP41455.1 hypothetical protein FN924_15495 [Radiobacillus deserti]